MILLVQFSSNFSLKVEDILCCTDIPSQYFFPWKFHAPISPCTNIWDLGSKIELPSIILYVLYCFTWTTNNVKRQQAISIHMPRPIDVESIFDQKVGTSLFQLCKNYFWEVYVFVCGWLRHYWALFLAQHQGFIKMHFRRGQLRFLITNHTSSLLHHTFVPYFVPYM